MYVIYVNLYFVLCLKVRSFTQVGETGHNNISANIKFIDFIIFFLKLEAFTVQTGYSA